MDSPTIQFARLAKVEKKLLETFVDRDRFALSCDLSWEANLGWRNQSEETKAGVGKRLDAGSGEEARF